MEYAMAWRKEQAKFDLIARIGERMLQHGNITLAAPKADEFCGVVVYVVSIWGWKFRLVAVDGDVCEITKKGRVAA